MLNRRAAALALCLCLALGMTVPALAEEPETSEQPGITQATETPAISNPFEAPETAPELEITASPTQTEASAEPEAAGPLPGGAGEAGNIPAPAAAKGGAEAPASGTCGQSLSWTLDADGVLTVSGTGSMQDYTANQPAPWGASVSRLVIEEGVDSIGNYAFYQCKQLSEASLPDSLQFVGDYSFYECTSLSGVSLCNISELGTAAFQHCSGLASVQIESLAILGYSAFSYCASLTRADISSVRTIYDYAFSGCASLDSAAFLENAAYIGPHAFEDCGWLTNLVIPNDVHTIKESVFSGCGHLASVTIPLSVEVIEDNAFAGCESLSTVYYAGNEENWQSIDVRSGNDILSSENLRIYHNTGEHAVTVSNSLVQEVNPWEEGPNTGAGSYRPGERVTLHAGNLPGCEFAGWDLTGGAVLDSPDSPDAVFTMPNSAVTATARWRNPETGALIQTYGTCGTQSSDLYWNLDQGGVLTVLGEGAMRDFHTSDPAPWRDSPVKVVVREGVTAIGKYAFNQCAELASASLPGSVASIGQSAFQDCSELAGFAFPKGLTSIGAGAFYGCSSLTGVHLPEGLTTIEDGGFSDCYGLAAVILPNSLTSIGGNAFANCWSLESVVIPAGASIGSCAFMSCESLTSAVIRDGVTAIADSAFSSCEKLASAAIPASVKTIGTGAFYRCPALKTVCYGGSEADWQAVSIGANNEALTSAGIHYNTAFHTVSVLGSFAAASGTGDYLAGTEVSLHAGTRPGWRFTGWTVTDGVVLNDPASPDAVFTMPNGPVTASAGWRPDVLELPALSAPVQSGGSATVTVSAEAAAAVTAASIASSGKPPLILAAQRKDSGQDGAVTGRLDVSGGEISFDAAPEALEKIFYLAPDTFIPLAKPTVLQ